MLKYAQHLEFRVTLTARGGKVRQKGPIDKCDVRVIAAGATALETKEVSPTTLKILFPNELTLGCVSQALASIIEEGTFAYDVIPEEKAIEIRDFTRIDCETLGLGGGCEFLAGSGRWVIKKYLGS